VVLLNTAGAMNNKGLLSDYRILLAYPLLLLIDFILSVPAWAESIFKRVSSGSVGVSLYFWQPFVKSHSRQTEKNTLEHCWGCHLQQYPSQGRKIEGLEWGKHYILMHTCFQLTACTQQSSWFQGTCKWRWNVDEVVPGS
jgi:hypothetical protein